MQTFAFSVTSMLVPRCGALELGYSYSEDEDVCLPYVEVSGVAVLNITSGNGG